MKKLSTLNSQLSAPIKSGSTNKGFTLIELLVVMGIIGVLATGLMITLDPLAQMKKGRDAERKGNLALIQRALEEYYNDTGLYPTNTADFRITPAGAWGGTWGQYMRMVPKDPDANRRYVYVQTSAGQGYYLYTSLERGGRDKDACNSSDVACNTTAPDSNSCRCANAPGLPLPANDCDTDNAANNSICNYGVSSSNLTP